MSETHVYAPAPVSARRLWYGVSAAPAAWIVHGLVSFVISDGACSRGHVEGLRTLLIAITAVALAVAISGGIVAWRTRRMLSTSPFGEAQAWGRGEFMALTGVFMSTIFSIGILWAGLAPILTGLCEATR